MSAASHLSLLLRQRGAGVAEVEQAIAVGPQPQPTSIAEQILHHLNGGEGGVAGFNWGLPPFHMGGSHGGFTWGFHMGVSLHERGMLHDGSSTTHTPGRSSTEGSLIEEHLEAGIE